jgi:hypothetical protein
VGTRQNAHHFSSSCRGGTATPFEALKYTVSCLVPRKISTPRGGAVFRFDEVLAKADESIRLFRDVLAAEPNPKFADALAVTINFRGVIHGTLGKPREAEACFREAAGLRDGVDGHSTQA